MGTTRQCRHHGSVLFFAGRPLPPHTLRESREEQRRERACGHVPGFIAYFSNAVRVQNFSMSEVVL